MSTNKDEMLRRYLDGELNDEEERQALLYIAEDPELRALMRFDIQLRQDLPAGSLSQGRMDVSSSNRHETHRALPEGFADRVMMAIENREQKTGFSAGSEADQNPVGEPGMRVIRGLRDWFWQPRKVMWRPVWSAGIAAVILLLMVAVPIFITTGQEPSPVAELPVRQIVEESTERVMMRFVYVDRDAESVAVAGDFSDWEPITLNRQSINGDVAWTGIIPLPRGEHRYMFIKDGEQWTTDPLANRHVDDGFGNKNAVINL